MAVNTTKAGPIVPVGDGVGGPASPMYLVPGPNCRVYLSVQTHLTRIWKLHFEVGTDDYLYNFHPDGRVLEAREPITQFLARTFQYDTAGQLTHILDRTGRAVQLTRSAGGAQITGPDQHVTSLSYDGMGRLTSVTDPDGGGVAITYHGSTQLMASFMNRNGVRSWYQYDSRGRLIRDWDSHGYVELSSTDGGPIVESDADGRVTQYSTHIANGQRSRHVRFPDDTLNSSVLRENGTKITTLADRTVITGISGIDPALNAVFPT